MGLLSQGVLSLIALGLSGITVTASSYKMCTHNNVYVLFLLLTSSSPLLLLLLLLVGGFFLFRNRSFSMVTENGLSHHDCFFVVEPALVVASMGMEPPALVRGAGSLDNEVISVAAEGVCEVVE